MDDDPGSTPGDRFNILTLTSTVAASSEAKTSVRERADRNAKGVAAKQKRHSRIPSAHPRHRPGSGISTSAATAARSPPPSSVSWRATCCHTALGVLFILLAFAFIWTDLLFTCGTAFAGTLFPSDANTIRETFPGVALIFGVLGAVARGFTFLFGMALLTRAVCAMGRLWCGCCTSRPDDACFAWLVSHDRTMRHASNVNSAHGHGDSGLDVTQLAVGDGVARTAPGASPMFADHLHVHEAQMHKDFEEQMLHRQLRELALRELSLRLQENGSPPPIQTLQQLADDGGARVGDPSAAKHPTIAASIHSGGSHKFVQPDEFDHELGALDGRLRVLEAHQNSTDWAAIAKCVNAFVLAEANRLAIGKNRKKQKRQNKKKGHSVSSEGDSIDESSSNGDGDSSSDEEEDDGDEDDTKAEEKQHTMTAATLGAVGEPDWHMQAV